MFDRNDLNNLKKFNLNIPHIEPPVYDEDCDMIDICEDIGATYEVCYKGCDMIGCDRCSIDTKQQILQQHRAEELAKQNLDNMEQESQKTAIRSWIQLILAAIFGGVITKLLEWIFSFI